MADTFPAYVWLSVCRFTSVAKRKIEKRNPPEIVVETSSIFSGICYQQDLMCFKTTDWTAYGVWWKLHHLRWGWSVLAAQSCPEWQSQKCKLIACLSRDITCVHVYGSLDIVCTFIYIYSVYIIYIHILYIYIRIIYTYYICIYTYYIYIYKYTQLYTYICIISFYHIMSHYSVTLQSPFKHNSVFPTKRKTHNFPICCGHDYHSIHHCHEKYDIAIYQTRITMIVV